MTNLERPVAVFYEHPRWFRFLFAELDRRGIPYVRLDAAEHTFCVDREPPPWSLVLNRMSPSAYLRGRGHLILLHLPVPGPPGAPRRPGGQRIESVGTGLVGTPDRIARRLDELEDAGVDLVLLQMSPQLEEMERFADRVMGARVAVG